MIRNGQIWPETAILLPRPGRGGARPGAAGADGRGLGAHDFHTSLRSVEGFLVLVVAVRMAIDHGQPEVHVDLV